MQCAGLIQQYVRGRGERFKSARHDFAPEYYRKSSIVDVTLTRLLSERIPEARSAAGSCSGMG